MQGLFFKDAHLTPQPRFVETSLRRQDTICAPSFNLVEMATAKGCRCWKMKRPGPEKNLGTVGCFWVKWNTDALIRIFIEIYINIINNDNDNVSLSYQRGYLF